MALPPELQQCIERELAGIDRTQLAGASEQISDAYRLGRFHGILASARSRAAYLIARLPATFAANARVFTEVARLMPEFTPQTFLDLGAGPGTAMFAARQQWPQIAHTILIESNKDFLQMGMRLSGERDDIDWRLEDLSASQFPPSDLVVMSYALGELQAPDDVIEKAWQASQKMLVIVEPGTPRSFATVASVRQKLLQIGAHLLAPCPHENRCPMADAGDWCHFSVRLPRSSDHRRLKGGALGYEDEKFSYLAFSKTATAAKERIVRHPAIHRGHIQLTLCTPEGLVSRTVTKSRKDAFRAARKAAWGDAWDPADQLE